MPIMMIATGYSGAMPREVSLMRHLLSVLACYVFLSFQLATAAVNVAVLYPQLEGGYNTVFENIMQGVDGHPGISVRSMAMDDNTTEQDISDWLDETGAEVLLALGQRCYIAARSFIDRVVVVHGAVVISPNGHSGVSLAGNPKQFLERLSLLAPNVRRVSVVYSEHNSGWLIEMAKKIAPRYNIQLVAYRAEDVREAAHLYQVALENATVGDAFWLPLDSVVPDRAVLPMVLREAWDRRLVVFSNNPQHAKRGALFALYPDNVAHGEQIAELILEQLNGDGKPLVLPTNTMKLSVNKRTASHLQVNLDLESGVTVDQIYPSR